MSPGTRSRSGGGVSSAISMYCPCGVVARAASTLASIGVVETFVLLGGGGIAQNVCRESDGP